MRRLAQYGGHTINLVLTPDLVIDMRNAAKTLVTQIHINREFNLDGVVPRLGPDIPQWFGDTIGFWDGEVLISWTSNIQAWINHGGFEFSNRMQSIEIYTPRTDTEGNYTGIVHEIILYDPEALAEPVRIVHYLDRAGNLNAGDPFPVMECVQHIFPINGIATPKTPGQVFDYSMPDVYNRPWAKIWEEYHEKGMQRPEDEDVFNFE